MCCVYRTWAVGLMKYGPYSVISLLCPCGYLHFDGMKWWTWSTLQYDVVWSKYWTNDDELYTCMVATSWGQCNTCRFWNYTSITTMSHRSSLCSCIALDPPLPDGIDIAFIWWMLHWCEEFWLKCLCWLVAILTFWYDTIKLWLVHWPLW